MRSMWKGSLCFGLVNIPIEMYRGSRERELKFVLLHDTDHSPIRYARICKDEEKEVPWSHVVKGYESETGKFVMMSDTDSSVEKTRWRCKKLRYYVGIEGQPRRNQDEKEGLKRARPCKQRIPRSNSSVRRYNGGLLPAIR